MDTAAAFRDYRASPSLDARNAIVEQWHWFSQACARYAFPHFAYALSCDEIESLAAETLIWAVEHYDPDRGASFKTFSGGRIRGAILDEMRRRDHLSRNERAAGCSRRAPVSLEAEEIPEAVDPRDEFEQLARVDELDQALVQLPERERMIVVLHKLEGVKMAQLADLLGVTESRVSQLYTQGLSRLRAAYTRAAA